MPRPDRRKWLVGLLLTGAVFAALTLAATRTGPTDDLDAYLDASMAYADWLRHTFAGLVRFDASGFGRAAVDSAFSHNAEHPPLAKLAMGAAWLLLRDYAGTIVAARMGVVVVATCLAWLVFSLAWDFVGEVAAVAAVLLLYSMPRFFFHAHVETLDLVSAATCFFAISSLIRGLYSTRWAVVAGFATGLALLAKLNGFFLFPTVVAYAILATTSPRAPGEEGRRGVPLPVLSMPVIGLNVFLLGWPWLWFDTWTRLGQYVRFHQQHYGILFYYFGTIYETPPAPWHAPFVMTAITTPPATLVCAIVGAFVVIAGWVRRYRHPPVDAGRPGTNPQHRAERRLVACGILLLHAFFAIGAVAFLGAPKYGGVKLFLPLFPPLAVLAGVGVETLRAAALTRVSSARRRRWLGPFAVCLAAAPACVALVRIHPYELSYYASSIGGLEGAVRFGFERQYYDVFYLELAAWLGRNSAPGTTVTFLPNNKEYERSAPWMRREGWLRKDLEVVDLERADVLVLTHERRWPEYPELAARYAGYPVLWSLQREGVPLLTVYDLRSSRPASDR